MQLEELCRHFEAVAPPEAAAAWDCSGLQVASHRKDAAVLGLCLDPTPASVRGALDMGAQCILCHHPLTLKPALPRRLDAYHETLRLLLAADVPLYAAHTSLDGNPAGPVNWLARELSLQGLAVLEPTAPARPGGALPLGFGLAGDLPEARTLEEILRALSRHIDLSAAAVCGPVPDRIGRIAYCTGSGSSLWPAAQSAGAQLYITGDVKYHTALEAGIGILDVGHHSLEEEMMRRLALALEDRLELRVVFVPSVSPLRPLSLP